VIETAALVMPVELDAIAKQAIETAKEDAKPIKAANVPAAVTKEDVEAVEVTKEDVEAAEDALRDTRQLLEEDFGLDMPPRPRPMRRRRPHRRGPMRFSSPWLFGYNGQI
jgi:hypothetical protein